MSLTGFEPERPHSISSDVRDPRTRLKVLFILAVLPSAAIASFAPRTVALPLACLISLILAMACAGYAWRYRINYRAQGLTFWDLAGMLALIGFGAGAMSEPASDLELFGMNATR